MDLANKIIDIRRESGLTQREFAERLYVTRQAVSRWENGETTPTVDTLKTISELFGVDANAFFGRAEAPICQSCSMPIARLDDMSVNEDKTVNTEYCGHCYADGKFTHNRTIEEMVESNLRFLNEFNAESGNSYTEDEAWTILKMHLATLKRWNTK
jgi:transcriptional regulator with XRE-family HTH domain